MMERNIWIKTLETELLDLFLEFTMSGLAVSSMKEKNVGL